MVGFNERKREILLTLYNLNGATGKKVSDELGISVCNARTRLKYYLYDGKWGYVHRKETNYGYKYYLNRKGKRWLRNKGLI